MMRRLAMDGPVNRREPTIKRENIISWNIMRPLKATVRDATSVINMSRGGTCTLV